MKSEVRPFLFSYIHFSLRRLFSQEAVVGYDDDKSPGVELHVDSTTSLFQTTHLLVHVDMNRNYVISKDVLTKQGKSDDAFLPHLHG